MAKRVVIGNMKTTMNYDDVIAYIDRMKKELRYTGVILCPTSLYMPYFKEANFKLGLQNIFYENTGSYTGEILPSQAKSMKIKYTIIGHSERRNYLNESNTVINKKVKTAVDNKMGVILCIGETKEERTMMRTEEVLRKQIYMALKGIDNLKNVVIAYEPIWSIGTGLVPSKRDLEKTIKMIKHYIKEYKEGYEMNVLYGGSVNSENIEELVTIKEINGFLVGGASTKADEFLKIIDVVKGSN